FRPGGPPPIPTRSDRLVRRRTFRLVHVQWKLSPDIGHLGPSAVRGSQAVSGDTHGAQRESRNLLTGRPMDRVYDRRDRTAQRLRSVISSRRRKDSDLAEWRTESALAWRWQRVVLYRFQWGDDVGVDRRNGYRRGRGAKDNFFRWRDQHQQYVRGDEGWTAIPR